MTTDWRDKSRERVKEKQQGSRFKLSDGENCIRVLPSVIMKDGKLQLGGFPYIEYFMHSNVGPDERFLRCGHPHPASEYDESDIGSCWLCDEVIPKLNASNNSQKIKLAAMITSKEQVGCQIAYMRGDRWMGPVLLERAGGSAKALSTKIINTINSTKRDYLSLSKGYNINIEKSGSGVKGTDYSDPYGDEEPSAVPREIQAKMKPLVSLVPKYSESEQKAAFYGRAVETETGYESYEGSDGTETTVGEASASDDNDVFGADMGLGEDTQTQSEVVDEKVVDEIGSGDGGGDSFDDIFSDIEKEEPPKKEPPAAPKQERKQTSAPASTKSRPTAAPTRAAARSRR